MKINDSNKASTIVTESDTAQALADTIGGAFPAVYATSKMIALMELSAAELMAPLLKDGELSVGVGVNIMHLAATPVGEEVTAQATYLGLSNKLYEFTVIVSDRGGVVGKGTHTRAIINVGRMMSGTKKRLNTTD